MTGTVRLRLPNEEVWEIRISVVAHTLAKMTSNCREGMYEQREHFENNPRVAITQFKRHADWETFRARAQKVSQRTNNEEMLRQARVEEIDTTQ